MYTARDIALEGVFMGKKGDFAEREHSKFPFWARADHIRLLDHIHQKDRGGCGTTSTDPIDRTFSMICADIYIYDSAQSWYLGSSQVYVSFAWYILPNSQLKVSSQRRLDLANDSSEEENCTREKKGHGKRRVCCHAIMFDLNDELILWCSAAQAIERMDSLRRWRWGYLTSHVIRGAQIAFFSVRRALKIPHHRRWGCLAFWKVYCYS